MQEVPPSHPALSIVMPVFNSGKYVSAAIRSILQQSFTDFELIIVEDGSTDESREIIASFDDKRIKLLQNERNMGIVYSRNRGLEIASGTYYAPFDADDVALPGKFHKQISFLKRNPAFGIVGCRAYHIDGSGNRLPSRWRLPASPGQIPPILLFRNYFVHSAVVMRRSALPGHGYISGYTWGEDYEMLTRIDLKWKMWNIPEYLVEYRITRESEIKNGLREISVCEAAILQNLYKKLEITLSDHQIELLLRLRESRPDFNHSQRQEIEKLFVQIFRQNQVHKIYNQFSLTRVLANRWLKARMNSLSNQKWY